MRWLGLDCPSGRWWQEQLLDGALPKATGRGHGVAGRGQMLNRAADVRGKRPWLPRTEGDGEGKELMEAKMCVHRCLPGEGADLFAAGEAFGFSVTRWSAVLNRTAVRRTFL